jgi:uncharacterized protein (TIGR04141 family)
LLVYRDQKFTWRIKARETVMASRRLTVHLLRGVTEFADAVDGDKSPSSERTTVESGVDGVFYYASRPATEPPWVSLIRQMTTDLPDSLRTSSASGLLVVRAADRFFALTFGFGRTLLDLSKVERNFGLRVALNRIDPAQLRSMDTKTFEDLVVTTSTQASKSADLPTFGVDVSRDILRAVTGEPRDTTFAKRLSGSDALVMNVDQSELDLTALCTELLAAYGEETYKADFEWIDHMALVSDPALVESLNGQLLVQLRAGDIANTHMAMPEPIDWEDIDSFKIAGARGVAFDDLDLDAYLAEIGAQRDNLSIDLLKSRRVSVRFSRSSDYESRWNVYQCLVTEQRIDLKLYVLIEGRWLAVSGTLSAEVDEFASALPKVSNSLIASLPGEREDDYNLRLVESNPDKLLLLDKKIKRPGGASSGIELCDVLGADGELIHVKRKSRSSTLSHLFAQGAVSAVTLVSDGVFRDRMREVIDKVAVGASRDLWLGLMPASDQVVDRSAYNVGYVIIADSSKQGMDWLPFFSKLNLMQHGKQLRNLGFRVSVARVGTQGS